MVRGRAWPLLRRHCSVVASAPAQAMAVEDIHRLLADIMNMRALEE
jgi:hypothetical protein